MSSDEVIKPGVPATDTSSTVDSSTVASTNANASVPEPKAVVDKIADAAPRADPRDITKGDALDTLKNVDRTILRLNKYISLPIARPFKI